MKTTVHPTSTFSVTTDDYPEHHASVVDDGELWIVADADDVIVTTYPAGEWKSVTIEAEAS